MFLGMNSDLSKYIQNNDKYLKALNLRPVTTLGESNGSLSNVQGNNCEVTFPNLRGVYKLKISKTYDVDGVFYPGKVTLTINGNTTAVIDIFENTTPSDVASYIKNLSNCYNGTYNPARTFAVAYSNDYIYIYQNPEYRLCSTIQSTNPVVSTIKLQDGSDIGFITPTGELTAVSTYYVPQQSSSESVIILGSTSINDTNYLLTTGSINSSKLGQIWELDYNELTQVTKLKLMYNSYLNLTKNAPIPPTAIIGRYELPTIKRLYWSDFLNPVRSVNLADANLMAIEPSLVDLKNSIELSVPTLKEINDGGSVNQLTCANTYQCAYRLVKNNGGLTNYSIPSNLVTLIPQETSLFISPLPNFSSIAGDSTTVDKTITWEVNGVDTNFDKIEFFVIVRLNTERDVFNIYKYEEQIIGTNSTISTTFTNDTDNMIDVTVSEFLIENTTFTHCKSIEQKDNRLFYANIKNSLGEYLDTYDTRTYRFGFGGNGNIIRVKRFNTETIATTYIINSNSDYNSISESSDNIPVFNLGMSTDDDPLYTRSFIFKKNSSLIGGEGPNIKYSFGSVLFRADLNTYTPTTVTLGNTERGTTRDNNASTQVWKNGYRTAGAISNTLTGLYPTFNNGSSEQKYYNNNAKMTLGLEYFSGNFRSYQPNEIYRFGIVFKSKTGTSYFAKWIGDIKFPNYNDPIDPDLAGVTDSGVPATDFRSLIIDGTDTYLNIPYIQFEVNIPDELYNLIDGYEIVRVDRQDKDKTIPTTGLVNQTMMGRGSQSSNFFLPMSHYIVPGGVDALDPATYDGSTQCQAPNNVLTYHSFDYLAKQSASQISNGDKLIFTEKYTRTTNAAMWPDTAPGSLGSYEEYYYINKYYATSKFIYNDLIYSNSQQIKNLTQGEYCSQGGETPMIGIAGGVYKNHNYQWDGNNASSFDSDAYSVGSPTIVLGVDSTTPVTWEDYNESGHDVVDGDSKLLAMHYKPSNLISQYGGRTYLARTNNEYISTGALYKITNAGSTKLKVFGGDIFYGILDVQKAIKNFSGDISPAPTKHSQTWYFPTQSVYNVDLRRGVHVNADLNQNDGTYASGNDEFFYDEGYSFPNNLKTYLPKPEGFNSTSMFSNRVYWSDVKINGDTSDSWSDVPVNNYYDVDGNYGGINALITLKNNMYAIQDTALSILYVNPTSIITDQNNLPLQLGTGSTLEKHFYHSVDIGSKHQWSISKSPENITFVDIRHNKIYLFNGETLNPISDSKGNRGFMNKILHDTIRVNDNPILYKGILTTYDYKNNEFLYTFLNQAAMNSGEETEIVDEKYTLAYSDLTDAFTSFYSFTPYIYINNRVYLYTPKDYSTTGVRSKLYMHDKGNYCTFYDAVYPSSLKVNINDNPTKTKVYDNLSWTTESIKDNRVYIDDLNDTLQESDNVNQLDDTFNRVRVYNEYQNSDWVELDNTAITGNLRKVEQGWNIQIPRNKVNFDSNNINTYSIFDSSILTKTSFGDRIKDKYMIVDLEYDNASNNRFIISNIKTTYRTSDR